MTGTYTDSTGMFVFTGMMQGGPYSFMFISPGYRSQTLSGYYMKKGSTLSMLVRMINSAASADNEYTIHLKRSLTLFSE